MPRDLLSSWIYIVAGTALMAVFVLLDTEKYMQEALEEYNYCKQVESGAADWKRLYQSGECKKWENYDAETSRTDDHGTTVESSETLSQPQ